MSAAHVTTHREKGVELGEDVQAPVAGDSVRSAFALCQEDLPRIDLFITELFA
jgi:hypothetical protein